MITNYGDKTCKIRRERTKIRGMFVSFETKIQSPSVLVCSSRGEKVHSSWINYHRRAEDRSAILLFRGKLFTFLEIIERKALFIVQFYSH